MTKEIALANKHVDMAESITVRRKQERVVQKKRLATLDVAREEQYAINQFRREVNKQNVVKAKHKSIKNNVTVREVSRRERFMNET